ncbi:DUF58 domain-containing protein [Speluncibacter jeojiensis]|uniref:DUF58 domain-containing protein n=1 Tax=Speluncibacter jeojiensis TaxID=2710754 RepID=A0A9X4M5G6_9ACTN|nr:DUF58 domain-containing protein [Corynebacteriales bacterium D3-21]
MTRPATQWDLPLHWRTSTTARTLATVAAVALAGAVLSGRWPLVVYAAPFLGALASAGWLRRPPARARVVVAGAPLRCFEAETVEVPFAVGADRTEWTVEPEPRPGLTVRAASGSDVGAVTLRVRVDRWGRHPVVARLAATAAGGLLSATERFEVAQIRGYPSVAPGEAPIPRTELPARIGTHLTAHHGLGVEYADIRGYLPGDQLRSINWAVSARRRRLHITERYTDRAADVVALIDAYPAAPGPAAAGLEWSVRGATQVVQSALQIGDRAGVVALGGRVRWLGPDIGRRQFYRVLDTVLDAGYPDAGYPGAGESARGAAEGTLAPRPAVPPGALVFAFTTLLETAFTLALLDLRSRGHAVVLIDVLRGAPFTEELDPLTAQMWRLGRTAMHRDLRALGVDVVEWPEGVSLEQALIPLVRSRPRRQRRTAHP